MTENQQHVACCIGAADSIAQRLANPAPGQRWSDDELRDMYRTLRDLEDRLYRQGEYDPKNVGALPTVR